MSQADKIFKDMCRDIILHGTSSKGQTVRPKWEDGSPAHTVKKFGVVNRYNLQEEFPALTLRKTALKSAMDEILWIYQKKSNNVNDLNSHIWDEWADQDGSIGKAYGYQQSKKYPFQKVTVDGLKKAFPSTSKTLYTNSSVYPMQAHMEEKGYYPNHIAVLDERNGVFWMNQIDKVIYDLVNTPTSRRIMTNLYDFNDLSEMALYPCAYSMTFNVTGDRLNGILNQRSQDILAANNWNVCQYSILLMMIAQVTGYKPGELVHVIADAHIYDRHIPIIKTLIERDEHPAPQVHLNPYVLDFYEFSTGDLFVDHYETGEQVKDIPIAV